MTNPKLAGRESAGPDTRRAGTPGRALRRLLDTTAARCRGRTLVVQAREIGLDRALRRRGVSVEQIAPHELGAPAVAAAGFGTVTLIGALEHLPPAEGDRVLARAWEVLAPGGRLVVTVPNEDFASAVDQVRWFDRRALATSLRPFGKAKLTTDQPYRWLTMYLEKPCPGHPRIPRTRRERYRVTGRLCRGRVLELGCGEGHLVKTIGDRGHEVVGADLSREKIEAARRAYPGLEFRQCDILALDLPARTFDTVILAEVLEHVAEEPGATMLDRAWEFVKPGGRLIVSVPNESCIPHRNHVREFDRRGLKRRLRRFGRPRLVTAQPYQWLMMYVDKEGER